MPPAHYMWEQRHKNEHGLPSAYWHILLMTETYISEFKTPALVQRTAMHRVGHINSSMLTL